MNNLQTLFFYVYYRITKAFYKWDGKEGFTAICTISIFQTLTISFILISILRLIVSLQGLFPHSKTIKIVGVALGAILLFYNYFFYSNKFNELDERWRNESNIRKWFLGIGIILLLILPFLGLILLGIR